MPRIDELLASVIKGATEAGASVEQLTIGSEQKLAGLGGAAGSLAGPLGSAAGAGLQDKNWGSAAGAGAGALLGGAAGTALGGMAGLSLGKMIDADPHLSQTVGSILGMLGGGAAGGHLGQNALRPEKQANMSGFNAGFGGAAGSLAGHMTPGIGMTQLGGALGAASTAEDGHRLQAALGSVGGGILGKGLGGVIGGAFGHPEAGKLVGLLGGSFAGGHDLGHKQDGILDKIRGKFSSAEDAYLAGSAAAASQYKVAIAPLIAGGLSMLAGPLARAGLGRVAGGALGKMGGGAVGRAAGGMANFAKKPMGGMMFDTGASMAAQSAMS